MLVLPPYIGIDVCVYVYLIRSDRGWCCKIPIEAELAGGVLSRLKCALEQGIFAQFDIHMFLRSLDRNQLCATYKTISAVKQRKPNHEHFLCSIASEPMRPQTKRNKLTNYGHENRQAQRGAHLHSRRVTEILKNLSSHNLSALAGRKCHSTIGKVKVCSGMADACW